jgi:uncharacterized flavoprotein (TIGR03862 family)
MPSATAPLPASVAIVGGGPAGLMAAETLARGGMQVDLFDAMPSVGRKFLLAGRGGLNITHSEGFEAFAGRYGSRRAQIEPLLAAFTPQALRDWVEALGVTTFVGTSGRVFPAEMKAAPLLRAWLQRLREAGVRFHVRHRWTGWNEDGGLAFTTPDGPRQFRADATVLALGGGSWAKLGSDGAWVALLAARGVDVAPLQPANCGFIVASPRGEHGTGWSEHFRSRFAGQPIKSVAMRVDGDAAPARPGEAMISDDGIEGSLVYALSAPIRERITASGSATLLVDLSPDRPAERVLAEVAHPRGARSLSSHLQSRAGISGVKMALLRECLTADALADPARLAAAIKALPLRLVATRPLDEAISSAGGVRFEDMDEHLMLRAAPGVFCSGEMLDWEAPTGGYLLSACFASGKAVGEGVLAWLAAR